MVVLGGLAVSCERGTPVEPWNSHRVCPRSGALPPTARRLTLQHGPNTAELSPTLGALFPQGGPVQDPVLTPRVEAWRRSWAVRRDQVNNVISLSPSRVYTDEVFPRSGGRPRTERRTTSPRYLNPEH